MIAPNIYMGDGKYVVFKLGEFNTWYNEVLKGTDVFLFEPPVALDDATVIRAQDVFAAPALYAYANSILVALEAMQAVVEGQLMGQGLVNIVDRLTAVADYFHEAAVRAEQTDFKKLPD